jgi:hypothetical protein
MSAPAAAEKARLRQPIQRPIMSKRCPESSVTRKAFRSGELAFAANITIFTAFLPMRRTVHATIHWQKRPTPSQIMLLDRVSP